MDSTLGVFPMKVAVIATGLEHIKRGVESWADFHAYALKDAGIDATLLKGSGKARSSIEEVVPCLCRGSKGNDRLYRIFSKLGGWRYGLGNPYEIEQVTFFLGLLFSKSYKLRQFDIIHLQDPILARALQWLNKIRLIKARTILGYGTGEKYAFLKKFKYFQVFAPYYETEFRKNGYINHKIYTIPHHVDVNKFSPAGPARKRSELGIPEDALVILSAAAIKKTHKRAHWLIEEVHRLFVKDESLRKKIFVVMAGAAEEETAGVMELAKTLKVDDRIKFMRDVPFADMPQIYRMADLFVICSLEELFGIVVIEAMASGLPVIANDFPVFKWIIGDCGDCINMTKEGELADAVTKYLDIDYLLVKKASARNNVLDRFRKEIVIAQTIDMYKDVLND
jgi:1,2-diacylglycerol 3-alpha-glucosyltransferase